MAALRYDDYVLPIYYAPIPEGVERRLLRPLQPIRPFQDTSAKLFNGFPSSIRQCQDFSTFIRLPKGHFATSKDTQN